MGILSKLLVVEVGKKKKRGEKGKTIKKRDKSLKRLLIILAKIWRKEFMVYLSKTI